MKDLMVLMATAMPEETIVNDIIKEAQQYASSGFEDEETKHKLAAICQIYLVRMMTEGDVEKAVDVIKKLDETEKARNLLNIDDHVN